MAGIKLVKKKTGNGASSSAYAVATTSTGGSPAKKRAEDDEKRYQAAAEKYASKNVHHGIGETIDDPRKPETVANIRSAYKKKNQSPNAEATNGGKPNAQKQRKAKAATLAQYGKGTSGIKMKKKGK
jgi:hypothetical protein